MNPEIASNKATGTVLIFTKQTAANIPKIIESTPAIL
jgi:hypothetical protein